MIGRDRKDGGMIKTLAGAAALALVLASPALAQHFGDYSYSVDPGQDMLEGQIIHWVGPQVRALQNMVYDEVDAAHTHPLIMSFAPMKAGDCRMTNAVFVINHDGAGEFSARTRTLAANADVTWHTQITLMDAEGRKLFETGDFVGPEMNDGKPGTQYAWVNKFTMDRATLSKVFSQIDHAQVSYAC
jgi:hypothetical protein